MDAEETTPLVEKGEAEKPSGIRYLIEVVLLLYASYLAIATLTIQQYVLEAVSEQYYYSDLDASISISAADVQFKNKSMTPSVNSMQSLEFTDKNGTDGSGTQLAIQQKIQSESSYIMLLLTVSRSLTSLFTASFLGPFSDVHGRKSAILVPLMGAMLLCIVLMVTAALRLSYWYLVIGFVLDGLCGSNTAALMCVFAYVADISTKVRISFKITIVEVCAGFAMTIGTSTSGLLINWLGYFYTFVILFGINCITILFVVCVLEESKKKRDTTKSKLQCSYLLGWVKLYLDNSVPGRRWKLQLNLVILLLVSAVLQGLVTPVMYFIKGPPVYFTAIQVGIYAGVSVLTQNIGGAVGVKVLGHIVGDHWMIVLGFTSSISALLMLGFSSTVWMVFVAPFLGVFGMLVVPMVRSISSKLVQPDQQGAIFAGIACAESVMGVVGVSVFNSIYSSTLYISPGFVFFTLAAVQAVGLVLASIQICLLRRERTIRTADVATPSTGI